MSYSATFHVVTLGCAKNHVDSETMCSALESNGYRYTSTPEDADLIIVNTCGFIQDAKTESVDTMLALRSAFPNKPIIAAGCFSQRYAADLGKKMTEVDAVFGNRDPARIVEVAETVTSGNRAVLVPDQDAETSALRPAGIATRRFASAGSAYVKVAEGCDNRCSYCAIPLIRGPLRSVTPERIVGEIQSLVDGGVREIILIAQDLASYGRDLGYVDLPDLVGEILKIDRAFWVRLLYLHPDHFPHELLPLCRSDDRLLPYFDIPFQHASRTVLRTMNRRGDADAYAGLIRSIRDAVPDAVIRSTFLVGFPHERRRHIDELLDFQDRVELDWLGVFTYSREEGTPAYRMDRFGALGGRIRESVARRRKSDIEGRQEAITGRRLDRFIGRTLDVLIEEHIAGTEMSLGRAYVQAPDVDGLIVVHGAGAAAGTVVPATVFRRNGVDLEARCEE